MTTETETDQESGSTLRAKLEASIAENKAFRSSFAEKLGVKPEDLADVAPSEFATKAAEIEAARAAERQSLLREALAEQGIADEDLDAAISKLKAVKAEGGESAEERVASLSSLGGTVPRQPEPQVWGEDRVRAAIHAASKR